MTLASEVETRIGTTALVQLTNPDSSGATTVNTSLLNAAIADVTGIFAMEGITLDITDARHLAVAVRGVRAVLADYRTPYAGGQGSYYQGFLDEVKRLSETTSRDRLLPVSNSEVTPSPERPPGYSGVIRPAFDRENQSGTRLRPPHGPGYLGGRGLTGV